MPRIAYPFIAGQLVWPLARISFWSLIGQFSEHTTSITEAWTLTQCAHPRADALSAPQYGASCPICRDPRIRPVASPLERYRERIIQSRLTLFCLSLKVCIAPVELCQTPPLFQPISLRQQLLQTEPILRGDRPWDAATQDE